MFWIITEQQLYIDLFIALMGCLLTAAVYMASLKLEAEVMPHQVGIY